MLNNPDASNMYEELRRGAFFRQDGRGLDAEDMYPFFYGAYRGYDDSPNVSTPLSRTICNKIRHCIAGLFHCLSKPIHSARSRRVQVQQDVLSIFWVLRLAMGRDHGDEEAGSQIS